MKKEIKFRAWDKRSKIYLYNVQNTYDTLSGLVKADYDKVCFSDFLNDKQYDVEQYTGMKDVNGKEIYEGDILKVKIEDSWQTAVPQLVKHIWDPHVWMAKSDPCYAVQEMIVIGNAHTNPEWLEVDR